ncbi:hypothetical protein GLOTRDRAFT_128742 [Gloeophyllum trabeum ATCC 11539]|uniref:Uncharacterized protein n=1 Tax=Gloeophyllum trabeum (strain ATCC 11539 / FP-39264 / Madison 617) TaxID=670483 RepID=S7Q651_GLOTA|nr:uncharacterized protein GLOTRDRAFT_128742 [Gloeophyllum trabeum ATCC 11539]EPQ55511.1 hypothetical protein GLOTRDRAFT_128742 [Gloeophyllum trabeum ATCC 11539]
MDNSYLIGIPPYMMDPLNECSPTASFDLPQLFSALPRGESITHDLPSFMDYGYVGDNGEGQATAPGRGVENHESSKTGHSKGIATAPQQVQWPQSSAPTRGTKRSLQTMWKEDEDIDLVYPSQDVAEAAVSLVQMCTASAAASATLRPGEKMSLSFILN